VFDKRGAGQSTGDWKTITYEGLADDYLAAVRFLEAQSGVNPKQVGIFGHSQGGTISPSIAARPGAVAFVIAAAAIGTGPIYTQALYRTRNDLEDRGFAEPDISRAMDLYSQWINVARTGDGWDTLGSAMAAAKNEGLQHAGKRHERRCSQAVHEFLPKRWRGRDERAALHQGKAVRQFLHRAG